MFCNQCEQTSKGKACTRLGICGKNEAVAIQQDKLVWQLRELAAVALMARDAGIVDTATDDFAFKALFSTLTNVNFDPVSLRAVQEECLERTTALAARVPGAPAPTPLAALELRETAIDRLSDDEDVRSAMQILLYGLKGVAAYADHAAELGQRDPDVAAFLYRGLRAGTELDPESHDLNGWLLQVLAARQRLFVNKVAGSQRVISVSRRVAGWLLHRSRMEEGRRQLELPGTRELMAPLLGLSRESLSRELNKLAREGAIRLERRRVELLDMAALERRAQD